MMGLILSIRHTHLEAEVFGADVAGATKALGTLQMRCFA